MRLFYTGVNEEGDNQENPNLSLGGHVSGSPLPNGAVNALFGGISQYSIEKAVRQVRAIVLKNETGGIVSAPSFWYDNISDEPVTNYRFAFVALNQDECGWYMEEISQGDALPINATFINPKTLINAVTLPDLPVDGYLGIWVERTYNKKTIEDLQDCDKILEKFNAGNTLQVSTIQTVADVTNSLDGKYFYLNTLNEKYLIWLSTGIAAAPTSTNRNVVGVTIATNDDAATVAQKVTDQINIIISERGEIAASVVGDLITITATLYGPFPAPADEDTGFTFTEVTTGVTSENETVEEIEMHFDY